MFTDEQRTLLAQPLDGQLIQQRDDFQNGRKVQLSYIAGHVAKKNANQIPPWL